MERKKLTEEARKEKNYRRRCEMYYLKGFTGYDPLSSSKTVFETDGEYVYETHYSNYADRIPVYYRRKMTIEEYERTTGHSFSKQVKKGLTPSN